MEKGFKIVTLSNLDFREQIKIFNNADVIVGLHGAAFANLCFCKPGTKVVEIKSNTAGKMIENIAISNELVYKSASSEVVEFDTKNQLGHINVSLSLLNKLI